MGSSVGNGQVGTEARVPEPGWEPTAVPPETQWGLSKDSDSAA